MSDETFRIIVVIVMVALAFYFGSHPDTWDCLQQSAQGC